MVCRLGGCCVRFLYSLPRASQAAEVGDVGTKHDACKTGVHGLRPALRASRSLQECYLPSILCSVACHNSSTRYTEMFLASAFVAMLYLDMCRHFSCVIVGRRQTRDVGKRFLRSMCRDCFLSPPTPVESWLLTRNVFFEVCRTSFGTGAALNVSGNHRRVRAMRHVM